ncbi:hypothetical protein DPMN_145844 [Dreissena polymorpha]|uniref:Uncharacterized protein n=1 Tax=Dreissena polymorpha TaxID=45954 RepID=A0A9D4IZ80_DREPO|nr:hypothetical protein DPMN_145844 [Dreissena polymorpha]
MRTFQLEFSRKHNHAESVVPRYRRVPYQTHQPVLYGEGHGGFSGVQPALHRMFFDCKDQR